MPKFAYAGVNRKVNYQLYLKYLHLCYYNIQKAARPERTEEEVSKENEEKVEGDEKEEKEKSKKEYNYNVEINITTEDIKKLLGALLAATIVTFLIFQRKAKPEKEIFTEETLKAGSIN